MYNTHTTDGRGKARDGTANGSSGDAPNEHGDMDSGISGHANRGRSEYTYTAMGTAAQPRPQAQAYTIHTPRPGCAKDRAELLISPLKM